MDELQLPLQVVEGSLDQLHIQIPWSSFGTTVDPVQLTFSGLNLVVKPVKETHLSRERRRSRLHARKMRRLGQTARLNVQEDATSYSGAMFAQLFSNIQLNFDQVTTLVIFV